MARLIVLVEGQTEETFVNELLRDHLYRYGYEMVSARLMGNARLRENSGIRAWNSVKRDILNHLKADKGCMVTTMVDYYRLPQSGNNAWPGRAEAPKLPFIQKAKTIEKKLLDAVIIEMGKNFDCSRFIPYIVMHEFEGLLFSDCKLFASGIGCESLSDSLQEIRDQFFIVDPNFETVI